MNEDNSSGLIPVTDHELFQATTARGFEPGQTIFNRFVLTRVLGRGGMGIVWLAHDTQLEQDVAIKVLPDVVMHDREAVTDMKRETKRSLQLNHHNIVRIYDFNQDDKGAGISMEFVDGETLSAAKSDRPHGCFDVEDIAPWVEQICDALAYAHHTAKIVHRDLKPANIMLNKNSTIKVTDFGIARSISDSISRVSMRHASSGTMVYMSPQQSSGARSSNSDDIYALGATIYDLLTGKPPFFSGNIQHQLENITPPSMVERRLEIDRHGNPIPEIWERAIASCLEKEPGRRPATVMELAQMLNLRSSGPVIPLAVASGEMVTAPGTSRLPMNRGLAAAPPTTSPPVPVYQPEPTPPGPPFFTPARMMIGGGVAAALLVVAIVVGLVAFLSRGHGSVAVETTPPGATVAIGSETKTTPATFDQVPSGNFQAAITLDGYDPMEVSDKVDKNGHADLGLKNLVRSTGVIAVTVIPPQATCTLRLIKSDIATELSAEVAHFSGAKVWQSDPPLKTGRYELVTFSSGLPEARDEIQVKRGDTQQIVIDVVKDDAAKGLQPDELAAVNSGDPLPGKFRDDATAKGQLTAYYQKAFSDYMKVGQFDLADAQLKRLGTDLGVATGDLQKQLDDEKLIAQNGQGTVSVKTDPAAAAVTLDGRTLPSPAVFDKILSGTKTVEIKLQGYDKLELPAQVTRDALTDLGTIDLTRSTGSVEITVIPRNASGTCRLVQSDAVNEKPSDIGNFSGPDIFKPAGLGTGAYSVTVTCPGFPNATDNFQVKAGDNLKITVDLVKQDAEHQLSPDQIAVVDSDQSIPDAMKQAPAAKATLTAYYQQVFNGYLKLKEFKLAENVLKHLSGDLGVESAQNQQQLDQLQTEWLASEKANLNQLIAQERFDDADAMLRDMEAHGPQPEMRDALTKAKAAHDDDVTKALADVDALESAGNEAGAYKAAVAAESKDKIEPKLAIRVATLELSMPSSYDRVATRVKAMNAMLAANSSLSQNPDFAEFNRLLGIFQKNLDKHNDFRSQIATLKKEVGSYDSRIASLRADVKHNSDKSNGYKILNAFGTGGMFAAMTQSGAGAGASAGAGATAATIGANGANARDNDVHRDQAEIEDLRNQQGSKQSELDQLKQEYEAFCQSPINAISASQ
jgi:hypothetical protein